MKEWLADQPRATTLDELQELLDRFRLYYNESRPHQGIDDDTPAERYNAEHSPSEIEPREPSPQLTYPPRSILRKVSRCGNLSFRGCQIQVGSEWNFSTLRIAVISGVIHIYYGEHSCGRSSSINRGPTTRSDEVEIASFRRKEDRLRCEPLATVRYLELSPMVSCIRGSCGVDR